MVLMVGLSGLRLMAAQSAHTAVVPTTQPILLLKLHLRVMQHRLALGMVSVLTMAVVVAVQVLVAMTVPSSLILLVTTWMQPITQLLQRGLLRKLLLQRG
jgi:hypothetical protein